MDGGKWCVLSCENSGKTALQQSKQRMGTACRTGWSPEKQHRLDLVLGEIVYYYTSRIIIHSIKHA